MKHARAHQPKKQFCTREVIWSSPHSDGEPAGYTHSLIQLTFGAQKCRDCGTICGIVFRSSPTDSYSGHYANLHLLDVSTIFFDSFAVCSHENSVLPHFFSTCFESLLQPLVVPGFVMQSLDESSARGGVRAFCRERNSVLGRVMKAVDSFQQVRQESERKGHSSVSFDLSSWRTAKACLNLKIKNFSFIELTLHFMQQELAASHSKSGKKDNESSPNITACMLDSVLGVQDGIVARLTREVNQL